MIKILPMEKIPDETASSGIVFNNEVFSKVMEEKSRCMMMMAKSVTGSFHIQPGIYEEMAANQPPRSAEHITPATAAR